VADSSSDEGRGSRKVPRGEYRKAIAEPFEDNPGGYWDGAPGDPGKLVVHGDDFLFNEVARALPRTWRVTATQNLHEPAREIRMASVLCFSPHPPKDLQDLERLLDFFRREQNLPLIGVHRGPVRTVVGGSSLWIRMFRPNDVFILGSDPRCELARGILRQANSRFFWFLRSQIEMACTDQNLLLKFAQRCLLNAAETGYPIRKMISLAGRIGCERTTLWRIEQESKGCLREFLRRLRVVSALTTYAGEWKGVEASLDETGSAMSHRFKRVLGTTRSEALGWSLRRIAEWAAEPIGVPGCSQPEREASEHLWKGKGKP